MYKVRYAFIEDLNQTVEVIKKFEGKVEIQIPIDTSNRHYREYLEWLAEGNEPGLLEE